MQSNKEWACSAAAMSLVLAEQCGQRPEKIVVNFENEDNPYGLQRRRLDTWGSPRMQRCYEVGFRMIPILAEEELHSTSAKDAIEKCWKDLLDASLVEGELGESEDEFSEVVSLGEEVIELLDRHSEAIERIATILATKPELKGKEIDEALERYELVFKG